MKTSAWVMVGCAALLLMVGEILLAVIFGVVAVLMFSNNKKAPAKTPVAKKTTPSVKNPTPVKTPSVQKTSSHRQTSLVEKKESAVSGAAPDAYAFRGTVEQYFLTLLEKNFPDYQVAQNASLNAGASQATGWTCSCGNHNTGKFCVECGSAKPAESTDWSCSCGQKNTGKFCPECGKSKPVSQAVVPPVGNTTPLTFLLSKNGAPTLGILLCDKHFWDTDQVQAAMNACKAANVPCLRFMREFRNDADYVTDRIRKSLR